MRRTALLFVTFTFAVACVGAVPRLARECPKVSVSCPDALTSGESLTFTATITDAPAGAKLTYNWVVSAGTIINGQGTGSIIVDTTGIGYESLTATVDVTGLPEACPDSASCATGVLKRHHPHDKIDEYGDISFEDEKARLDNLAIELQNWTEGVGYIVAYGGRRPRRGEALRRAERAKRYLMTVRGIPARHVVTMDGGYRESLTVELRARPKDMPTPEPYPTVDPKEVRFIKARPRRGARRR